MPAQQQRLGLDEEPTRPSLRYQTAQPGQDRTVGGPHRRTVHLTAKDRHFMAEHHNLDGQFVSRSLRRSRNNWSRRTNATQEKGQRMAHLC